MRHLTTTSTMLALALAGCTTMGIGTGSTKTGNLRADLTWQSMGGENGMMTANLSNGQSYSGRYFQITQTTRIDTLGTLWPGWGRRWAAWPYWGFDAGPDFITHYSGRVLANLENPNGTHMRCRFQLIQPTSGMAGGGQGECQLPGGQTIDTTFPPGSQVVG